jgi:Flp pilus assembly protein TadG
MVEFVIVLPLLFVLVFLIAYAGVGFNRYMNVTNAAQEGARAAATARFRGEDPCDAATTVATQAMGGHVINVTCTPQNPQIGDSFTVEVSYQFNIHFPLLPTGPSLDIHSSSTERIE